MFKTIEEGIGLYKAYLRAHFNGKRRNLHKECKNPMGRKDFRALDNLKVEIIEEALGLTPDEIRTIRAEVVVEVRKNRKKEISREDQK